MVVEAGGTDSEKLYVIRRLSDLPRDGYDGVYGCGAFLSDSEFCQADCPDRRAEIDSAGDHDARKNLHDSIRCALDDRSRDVMLVFDGKIIAGTRAKKTATFSYNAFSSINFPVLGQIHDNTVVYYIQKDICGPVRFFNRMDRKVFLLKLTPGMSTEIIPHILSVYDCIIIEGFGVGGLPDRLRQALLEEMQHYKAHEKILIMATQVTYEGSSMDTYVVGRAAREQLPFLETYDMTLEAVLAKIMWILGLHMEDRKEIERLFYKKINYDLFRNE